MCKKLIYFFRAVKHFHIYVYISYFCFFIKRSIIKNIQICVYLYFNVAHLFQHNNILRVHCVLHFKMMPNACLSNTFTYILTFSFFCFVFPVHKINNNNNKIYYICVIYVNLKIFFFPFFIFSQLLLLLTLLVFCYIHLLLYFHVLGC